jgi:phycobilisome core-membrane linker protein
MNTPGSITPRNFLGQSNANAGLWRADVGGQIVEAQPRWIQSQNNSIRQLPNPNRGWSAPRWQSDSSQSGKGVQAKGLKQALGLQSENAASKVFSLSKGASVAEKEELICAVYRQLLNRIPFASERLIEAESKFCNGQIDVAKFVAQVAANDLFQQRLWLMTPMAAASAAHMALLGRAPEAAEATAFLSGRAQMGQVKAIEAVLNSASYKTSFGANTVPYLKGLGSQPGMALSSLVRTATLYGGNGGLTPAIKPN